MQDFSTDMKKKHTFSTIKNFTVEKKGKKNSGGERRSNEALIISWFQKVS